MAHRLSALDIDMPEKIHVSCLLSVRDVVLIGSITGNWSIALVNLAQLLPHNTNEYITCVQWHCTDLGPSTIIIR